MTDIFSSELIQSMLHLIWTVLWYYSGHPHAPFNWRHSSNIYNNKISADVAVTAISKDCVTAGTNAIIQYKLNHV